MGRVNFLDHLEREDLGCKSSYDKLIENHPGVKAFYKAFAIGVIWIEKQLGWNRETITYRPYNFFVEKIGFLFDKNQEEDKNG